MANNDDDDDGIVLNFSQETTYVPARKTASKKEGRNVQKDRRPQKSFKERSNNHQSSSRSNVNLSGNKSVDDKDADSAKEMHSNAPKKPFEFISSLFSKNPEIPDVLPAKTPEIKSDDLFVEDAKDVSEISDRLIKTLKDRVGFENFTKVQQLSIPIILSRKDILIKSPTGSGKTLAYALPIIHQLHQIVPKINRSDGPYAVVLLPTRELALQSYEVFEYLCHTFVWIVPGLIVGGEKRKAEKSRIRKGINIVIATPGRLLDHLTATKSLSLKNVSYVIFDEADRLLDLGFQDSIVNILKVVKEQSKGHQTVLLSATLNPKVENLASISLKTPISIDTTKEDAESLDEQETISGEKSTASSKYVTPNTLKQYFAIVPAKLRLVALVSFLLKFGFQDGHGKLIVFFSSKSSTELHHSILNNQIVKDLCSSTSCDVYKLHGDMQQHMRNDVFKKFKKSSQGILLCTDVAARGLDLPQVNWIIQYSCPSQIDDYVHRVGRTARIGAAGKSLLFLLPSEVKYIERLQEQSIEMQEIKLFEMLINLLPRNAKKKDQSVIQDAATDLQNKLEETVTSTADLQLLAEQAFKSFIQAYATYSSSMKDIFHLKYLHLGHMAKSFALRKAPQQMESKLTEEEKKVKRKLKIKSFNSRKRKIVDMSEEGAGLMLQGPRPGKKKTPAKRRKK